MRIDDPAARAASVGPRPGDPVVPGAVKRLQDAADDGLDDFSRWAGPDVAIGSSNLPTRVFAVFRVDPGSRDIRISAVDDEGRLIRVIPPETAAEMLAVMAAYGRG